MTWPDVIRSVTFRILNDGEAIECLLCGLISYNPNDVAHRYCGNCHVFHDDLGNDRR